MRSIGGLNHEAASQIYMWGKNVLKLEGVEFAEYIYKAFKQYGYKIPVWVLKTLGKL